MFTSYTKKEEKRKKVNFMINNHVLVELKQWIPAGERSDFVNEILKYSLLQYKRRKAFEAMDKLRKKAKIRMTDADIIRNKNYGRP